LKRPSQRQKRIIASLGSCFCQAPAISKVAKSKGATSRRGARLVSIVRRCNLCRLVFAESQVVAHVLSHYEPIADKVAQLESLAIFMGGDNQAYERACEQVMGWRPWTSTATEFFRRQVSQC
jgi:hypothetical protein